MEDTVSSLNLIIGLGLEKKKVDQTLHVIIKLELEDS